MSGPSLPMVSSTAQDSDKNMMTGPGFTDVMLHQVNRQLDASFFFCQSVELMDLLLIAFYDKLRTDIHTRCDEWLNTDLGASFHQHIDFTLLSRQNRSASARASDKRLDSSGLLAGTIPENWIKEAHAQFYIQFCANEANFVQGVKEGEKEQLKHFNNLIALDSHQSTDQSFVSLMKLLCTIVKEIQDKYNLAVLFPPGGTKISSASSAFGNGEMPPPSALEKVINSLRSEYDKASVLFVVKLNQHLRRLLVQNMRLAVEICRVLEFLKTNEAVCREAHDDSKQLVNGDKEGLPRGTLGIFKYSTPPGFDKENFRPGSVMTRELLLTGKTLSCPIDAFVNDYFTTHRISEGNPGLDDLAKSVNKPSILPVPLILLWPLMQYAFVTARLFEERILDKLEQLETTTTTTTAASIAKNKTNVPSDKDAKDLIKQENLRLLFACIFRQPSRVISECINAGRHRELLSASWPPEFCIIGTSNSMPILSVEDKTAKPHLLKSRLTRLYENEFSVASKRGFEALYRNLAINIKYNLTEKHAMFTNKLFELLSDVSATMRSDACAVLDYNEDSFVCTIEYLKSRQLNIALPSPPPQSPERLATTSIASTSPIFTQNANSCLHRVYLETPKESLEAAEGNEEELWSNEMKLYTMITSMNCHRMYKGDPILSIVENISELTGEQSNIEVKKDDKEEEEIGKRPNVSTRSSIRRKRKRDETDSPTSSEENSTIADDLAEALKTPSAKRTKTAFEKTSTILPARERSKRRQSTRNG